MVLHHMIFKRRSELKIRIIWHILFWFVLCLSSIVLVKTSFDPYKDTPLGYLTPIRQTIGLMLVFYPFAYWVLPKILIKTWYFTMLYLFFLVLIYGIVDVIGEKSILFFCDTCKHAIQENHPDYLTVIQKTFIENILFKASNVGFFIHLFTGLLLPLTIKLSIDYYQAEQEKTQMELNFLKAQVHPHFLFNTLNNLYGLILHNRQEASAETVSRLSEYMRYSLENAPKETIALSEEITLIHNYIALESLRLNYTKIDFKAPQNIEQLEVPPLLFIPLIENAFKYHIDQKAAVIKILMEVDQGVLEFKIENEYDPRVKVAHQGGLGLQNLKKRLVVNFKNSHNYRVTKTERTYTAYLKLKLK